MTGVLDASTVNAAPPDWQLRGDAGTVSRRAEPAVVTQSKSIMLWVNHTPVIALVELAQPSGLRTALGRQRLETFLRQINIVLQTKPVGGDDPVLPGIATQVVETLAALITNTATDPRVCAMPDGGIAVNWVNQYRDSVDIEFDSDGDAVVLMTKRSYGQVQRTTGFLVELWTELVQWLD